MSLKEAEGLLKTNQLFFKENPKTGFSCVT